MKNKSDATKYMIYLIFRLREKVQKQLQPKKIYVRQDTITMK